MSKMSREDLFREIGEIDETYVEEAQRARRRRRVPLWAGRTLAAAASLILCVGVGYIALQMTQGGTDTMNGASTGGSAMDTAQQSMIEAADELAADGAASGEAGGAQRNPENAPENAQDGLADKGAENAGGISSASIRDLQQEPQELKEFNEQDAPGEESALEAIEPEQVNTEDEAEQNILTESCVATDAVKLAWDAARADTAYGRYVDVQIPEGYSYTSGSRSATALHVIWNKGMEEISISCRQADESVSDWLADTEKPEEYDLGLYTIPWSESVPAELAQKVYNAAFRPDQISQEIVSARSHQVEEQGDVSGWRTQIAILYSDNVLVEICSKGPSPEEIYRLINLEN